MQGSPGATLIAQVTGETLGTNRHRVYLSVEFRFSWVTLPWPRANATGALSNSKVVQHQPLLLPGLFCLFGSGVLAAQGWPEPAWRQLCAGPLLVRVQGQRWCAHPPAPWVWCTLSAAGWGCHREERHEGFPELRERLSHKSLAKQAALSLHLSECLLYPLEDK